MSENLISYVEDRLFFHPIKAFKLLGSGGAIRTLQKMGAWRNSTEI